jgi:hypothetical protein
MQPVPESTSFQILKHKETVDSLLENMGPEGLGRKNFKIWTRTLLTKSKNQQ